MKVDSLEILGCPTCRGFLLLQGQPADDVIADGTLSCESCQRNFAIKNKIVQFLRANELVGSNKRHEKLNNLFSHVYTPTVKLMFAFCGGEENARYEGMSRLELKEGAKILEVGIGTGDNLPYLGKHSHSFEVYGVDISRSMLRHCAGNLKKWGLQAELCLAEAEHLPFKDGMFDVVFHLGAINFFTDKKRAIEEMIRVARPGSKIVIADESEKALKMLDKFLLQVWIGRREKVVPPIDLVSQTMLESRLDTIWRGYGYCIEFRTPWR